jgi:hypothetical protein
MIQKFIIKEAISYGWQAMKANFWFFVQVLLIGFILQAGIGFLGGLYFKQNSLPFIIVNIISNFIGIIITLGYINIALKFHDKKEVELYDLIALWPLFFKYLLASILYSLIVIGGLILLIVPGIIWAIKFQFFGYFIVEGAGWYESFKKSGAITQGTKLDLFWLGLLSGLITLAGALFFLIGLFVAVPTVMLAFAFVYRKLQSAPVAIQPILN